MDQTVSVTARLLFTVAHSIPVKVRATSRQAYLLSDSWTVSIITEDGNRRIRLRTSSDGLCPQVSKDGVTGLSFVIG